MRSTSNGQIAFAATDLSLFLACGHLTHLRRDVALGLIKKPAQYDDPHADLLRTLGLEHEQRQLDRYRSEGLVVEDIQASGPSTERPTAPRDWDRERAEAAARTLDAMRRGVDVIYQGRLESADGRWSGYPDFLLKVERPSRFGAWAYEAADAKLTRTAKAGALLQLLLYSDLLTELQRTAPEYMHLALGGDDAGGGAGGDTGDTPGAAGNEATDDGAPPAAHHGRIERFRVAEYAAYYRAVRRRFDAHVVETAEIYPDPVDHCRLCDWKRPCADRRRADDHLSLVAGINRMQRQRLEERGVETMTALGELSLPPDPPLDGVSIEALTRVREQARVQVLARRTDERVHERITPVTPEQGLAALPEPTDADLFFDIEGTAYAPGGSLEYLFGLVDRTDRYTGHWGLDRAAEKRAFEAIIDEITTRWRENPGFHVYHYAPYETTAVKHLMNRYATREDDVDRLLHGGVFVDLHRVVRQGVRASVERYSIKEIEKFYRFDRQVDLRSATGALIDFEVLVASGGNAAADETAAVRKTIELYNRDDCLSTLRLADWLEQCRCELADQTGQPVPRPAPPTPPTPPDDTDEDRAQTKDATETLYNALTAGLPTGDDSLDHLDDDQRTRQLAASMLEFHRREKKATWWTFFEHCALDAEGFVSNRTTLGGLRDVTIVDRTNKSVVYRYRFPPQQHEIKVGDFPTNPTPPAEGEKRVSCGRVVALDDDAHTIDLRRKADSPVPDPTALVPLDLIDDTAMRKSLHRLGEGVRQLGHDVRQRMEEDAAADRQATTRPPRAAIDLLQRTPPRAGAEVGPPGASLQRPDEAPIDTVRRIAPALNHSVLAVQGPPGTGKTYTGARMIVDLLALGRKVGVTANSHKVISNLLSSVVKAAREAGIEVRGMQKSNPADGCRDDSIGQTDSNSAVLKALESGEVNLVGGTAWLWSREDMADMVDALVVDEAGQMSLANTLAVAQAAKSLVLLGDPRQLEQPIQGVHPPGVDISALGYLLDGQPTIAPDRGVFLEHTWRMHPDICRFTTEQFYEGRLQPRANLARQTVTGPGPLAGHGVRFVPVDHHGNATVSTEEADRVLALVTELIDGGGAWIDQNGAEQPLTLNDILIVAPYNAQVARLRTTFRAANLPDDRIGTVDKFQGQEAPIVLFSMASSTPHDAPRGMEFLYSLHRLNVATSRARCVAAIVASPAVFTPDCRTPQQMRLANAFCRFLELVETPAAS